MLYKVSSYRLGKSSQNTHERMSVKTEITFDYENSFTLEDLLREYQEIPVLVPILDLENRDSALNLSSVETGRTILEYLCKKVESGAVGIGREFLKKDLGHGRRKWPSQEYPTNHTSGAFVI